MWRSFVFTLFIICFSANASIDDILDRTVNITSTESGVYKSPTTTTATLGSYSLRIKTDLLNLPVFTIQPPRATLSCSGFDFDAGLISFLNLDTIQSMLEQAGTSLAWGVMIGLIYSIPGVAQTFQYLNELGRYSQMLGQGACKIGVVLGKSVGSSIFHRSKSEAESSAVASGIKSTFEEAIKSYKNFLKVDELFYTFPYTYLNENGFNDTELKNLIAGFFGVFDWKPYDANGNICTKKSCLDEKYLKILAKPPRIDTIDGLLNGGEINTYDCRWGTISVDGSPVNACLDIEEIKLNVQNGLIDKVYRKIDGIVDDLANGKVITSDNAAFLNSYGGLANVINALVLIKKEKPDAYKYYSYAVSQKISLVLLKSILYSARVQLMDKAGADMVNKASKDAVEKIYKKFIEADKLIRERLKEVDSDIKSLNNLAIFYATMKSDLEAEMKQKFGPYMLFMR